MKKKVLEKVLSGLSDKNVRFEDLRTLIKTLGLNERIKGDHFIFFKPGIEEIINIQPLPGGKAKAYQVRQVRGIILKYKIHEDL